MKTLTVNAILGICLLLWSSCKEKSTDPVPEQRISFISQSSACLSYAFAKSTGLDSVFTYFFSDSLLIDFSVISNCCPDSNRFAISQTIDADTLFILVADTARTLCKCICPYMIRMECANLPNDHYVVCCKIGNSPEDMEMIHRVNVYRRN